MSNCISETHGNVRPTNSAMKKKQCSERCIETSKRIYVKGATANEDREKKQKTITLQAY